MRDWIRGIRLGIGLGMAFLPSLPALVMAATTPGVAPLRSKSSDPPDYIRPQTNCPARLEDLVPLLLRDLPSYANRVSQRAFTTNLRVGDYPIPGYILVAGQAEYEPIELSSREYVPLYEEDTTQVFFTTLERHYTDDAAVYLQHFHRLFLTQTQNGWHVVLMFSAIGDVSSDEPPTPPQDTSQGVIAQAIRLWLRDCQAGSIEPPA